MQKDKQIAILKIANMAGKVSPDDLGQLKKIEREYLVDYAFTSNPFGKRFLERIDQLINGKDGKTTCVLCELKEAENKMVCSSCLHSLRIKATLFDNEINQVLGIEKEARPKRKSREELEEEHFKALDAKSILDNDDSNYMRKADSRGGGFISNGLESSEGGFDPEMDREMYEKFLAESKASDRYVENLIRNLDSSMERLASRKEIKDNKRLLIAILVICIINSISIVAITVLVFATMNILT